ncbi:MAG: metallophosphoesterase [Clostridia bacterium]|nr:metallophosphoesterase [Clostridia bacterium]
MAYSIPPHYQRIYDWTKEKAIRYATPGDLSFLFLTDLHIDYRDMADHVIPQCETAVELARGTKVDCIILGGDLLHGTSSYNDSLRYLKHFVQIFNKAEIPVFAVHGNHDDNPYHSVVTPYDPSKVPLEYLISSKVWTEHMILPLTRGCSVHDSKNPYSSYYYADFPQQHIRLIVMDTFDFPHEKNGGFSKYTSESWNRLSDRQIQWLVEEAVDDQKAGWRYLICSHGILDQRMKMQPFQNYPEVLSLYTAMNNREIYENTRLHLKKDFGNALACAPLHLYGHTHLDSYNRYPNEKMLMMGTGNCKMGIYPLDGCNPDFIASPAREKGTETEPLFDLYRIEKASIIHRIRFGAGIDQHLDFSEYCK